MENSKRSFLAGILISLGAYALLISSSFEYGNIIGAFLFSFALTLIILMKQNLFTGKIGKITKTNITDLLQILFFNLFATIFMAVLIRATMEVPEPFQLIALKKIEKPIFKYFIDSVFCGMVIHFVVLAYSKSNSVITIILPVMLFILSGFEHSIANSFILIVTGYVFEYFYLIPLAILGNSLGAIFIEKLNYE